MYILNEHPNKSNNYAIITLRDFTDVVEHVLNFYTQIAPPLTNTAMHVTTDAEKNIVEEWLPATGTIGAS